MFSSTLANFHVTNFYYHELCRFLRSIMPKRLLSLHYSTIGYNHLGKVAVMAELQGEFESHREPMNVAPGKPGTVAIAFCMPMFSRLFAICRQAATSEASLKARHRCFENITGCIKSTARTACWIR